MEWVRNGKVSSLYDDGVCILCIYGVGDVYRVLLEAVDKQYEITADSIEYVEWDAVNKLYAQCNRIANHYHKIRNHLPSIHELADRAGITAEIDAILEGRLDAHINSL